MRLRRASTTDLPLLAELNHQLIEDQQAQNPMTVAQLLERMRQWLAGDYEALIFEIRQEPVAYALIRPTEGGIHLRQFFVVRTQRRRGVGRNAIELLREEIAPNGTPITLEVLVHNTAGLAFWRGLGFQDHSICLQSPSDPVSSSSAGPPEG